MKTKKRTSPKYPNVTALIDQAVVEMGHALTKGMNKAIRHIEKTGQPGYITVPRKPFQNLLRLYSQKVPVTTNDVGSNED